jgi:hypothetical protein
MELGRNAVRRVLEFVLDGAVAAPQSGSSPAVAAAVELLRPRTPSSAQMLAQQSALLYGHHELLRKVRPQAWLSRMESLAAAVLPAIPEQLERVLERHLEADWVVVDCLGLPLMEKTADMLARSFPEWKLLEVQFGLASERSSTDAFYLGLVGRDFQKAFEKINPIDDLIHSRKPGFQELEKLGCAELEIALRKIKPRLRPGASMIVFGDHGFRLAPDGSGFVHGGASTLERIVPVFVIAK